MLRSIGGTWLTTLPPMRTWAAVFDAVVERRAVLGNQQWDVPVITPQPDEQFGQRSGNDRPAHRGLLSIDADVGISEDRTLPCIRDALRRVEVDPEEVDRLR